MPEPILHLIAIIPPGNICDEVNAFKKDFLERYGSKASLKIVPHITLKAPFKIEEENLESLVKWFKEFTIDNAQFTIELKDFGAFPKSKAPVIFIKPVLSEQLQQLQRKIIHSFKDAFSGHEISGHEKDFHPHMTIAYRDLSPEMFRQAWAGYSSKKYSAEFVVDGFYLLQHDGRQWQVIGTKRLKGAAGISTS